MSCNKQTSSNVLIHRQQTFTKLHNSGRLVTAFNYRFSRCVHATGCNRLCERLVKQPGKAGVFCVNVATGEKTDLYAALENPDFECPKKLF